MERCCSKAWSCGAANATRRRRRCGRSKACGRSSIASRSGTEEIAMILLDSAPTRPDTEVLHEVVEKLERDPRFREARVGVSVDADVVTLTGEVESVALKHRLEHAVHRVAGVVAVASELVAVRPEQHARDDHDLARAAAAALRDER